MTNATGKNSGSAANQEPVLPQGGLGPAHDEALRTLDLTEDDKLKIGKAMQRDLKTLKLRLRLRILGLRVRLLGYRLLKAPRYCRLLLAQSLLKLAGRLIA